MLGLNPGKGFVIGSEASQIVSPTLVSDNVLIPAIINPISPEFNSSTSIGFGVNTPTYSITYSSSLDINLIFIFFFIFPSIILTKITTPR